MAQGKQYINFILEERDEIENFIDKISSRMFDYVCERKKSTFYLFYKQLTHSDLATFGKATRIDSHDKNLLYYIKEKEMKNIEENTNIPFQTAHQSCIGLMKKWYEVTGLPQPRNTDPYLINDYCNVYLVNENLKYFTSEYTQLVFQKLGKTINNKCSKNWDFKNLDIKVDEGLFTPIELHCAVHGLGMSLDTEFHKLRHHLFKGDTLILLYEKNSDGNNMFLLFEKNPCFFSAIGEINKNYEDYQRRVRMRLIEKIKNKENLFENIEEEVTRQQQSLWRKMLAREMMSYTSQENYVFCPFTYISADFENLGSVFVASHIKGFSDPNTKDEEKYDINNGLLLSANADALFDKHLISVDKDKRLVFSYLLENEIILKQQLLLLHPIFQPILNEKRMKYLAYHYNMFLKLEEDRKR